MAFILFMSGVSSLFAQQNAVPVVHFDPNSRVALQAVPFDHSFFLLLPVDTTLQSDELKQLDLFKVNPTADKDDPSKRLCWLTRYDAKELKKAWFVSDTPKVAGIKYLKVFIGKQMLPNTAFSVILTLKPSHLYLDQLNDINQEIYDGDAASAENDYHKITDSLTIKNSPFPALWPSFGTYRQIFTDSILSLYADAYKEDTAIYNNLTRLADTLRSAGFRISELFKCNCEKDFVANELFSDSTKFLIPVQNLLNVHEVLPYFASGRANVQEFEPYKRTKENEFQKRINNYGKLKEALINISYFCHMSSFSDRFAPAVKRGVYNAVYDALPAIDRRIKALQDAYTKIRATINGIYSLFSAELDYGDVSPRGEDLQTSSGHYIIADFGLANALSFVNQTAGYVIRPYLGVNFSFIAIDKSQPLNVIQNKKFLHHLSFVLGLTTSPLSRQGTSDLINNLSLVGGLAYRVSRAARVTFGVLVYKRDNANPDLPQSVTVGPMIAGSLDLDLAKWFGDLKSKLY